MSIDVSFREVETKNNFKLKVPVLTVTNPITGAVFEYEVGHYWSKSKACTPACVSLAELLIRRHPQFFSEEPEDKGAARAYQSKKFTLNAGVTSSKFLKLCNDLYVKHTILPYKDFLTDWHHGFLPPKRLPSLDNLLNSVTDWYESYLILVDDGHPHLLGILLSLNVSNTKEAKTQLGKGRWKRYLKMSKTRQRLLSKNFILGYHPASDSLFDELEHVPSTLLKYNKVLDKHTLKFLKNNKISLMSYVKDAPVPFEGGSICARSVINRLRDLLRLRDSLGVSGKNVFNMKLRDVLEEHDRLTHRLNDIRKAKEAEKYKQPFVDILKDSHNSFNDRGVYFEKITTPTRLAQEGRDMKHCVASYISSMQRPGNDRALYSITTAKTGERSTLEIVRVFRGGKKSFTCGQHYSQYNSKPPREHITSVKAFLRKLNGGTWKELPKDGGVSIGEPIFDF